jgi:hypothetical protein
VPRARPSPHRHGDAPLHRSSPATPHHDDDALDPDARIDVPDDVDALDDHLVAIVVTIAVAIAVIRRR